MWKGNKNKTCVYSARSFTMAGSAKKVTLWVKQDVQAYTITTNYKEDDLYPLDIAAKYQLATREECDRAFRWYALDIDCCVVCAEDSYGVRDVEKESEFIYEK